MQSRYSAKMKQYARDIANARKSRSKSEATLCRLLIAMVEETGDIESLKLEKTRKADNESVNLRNENVGEESFKRK